MYNLLKGTSWRSSARDGEKTQEVSRRVRSDVCSISLKVLPRRTDDCLTANLQQRFGVEADGGHGGDHVLGVGDAELVRHGQGLPLRHRTDEVERTDAALDQNSSTPRSMN